MKAHLLLGTTCFCLALAPATYALSANRYLFGRADFKVADGAFAMVTADFNGDKNADFATASYLAGTVSVFLGTGVDYRARGDFAAGIGPDAIAVGDFDHDGHLDIVVANQNCDGNGVCGKGSVSVLLGNGDGTFKTHVDYLTDVDPVGVVVADLNGDGIPDLAVSVALNTINKGEGSVSILLGVGDGTFRSHTEYPAGVGVGALAAGDLNHDNHEDLVVTNYTAINGVNAVVVLMGNGDGTFQPPVSYETGFGPYWGIALADFNSDTNLDIAITNCADQGVSILIGIGDGTFRKHVEYSTAFGPNGIAVADFNCDGKLDLAVSTRTNMTGGGAVSVLLGNGDGTFQTEIEYGTGNNPSSIVASDVNGDGWPDVLFVEGGTSRVSVLLGGKQGFDKPVAFSTARTPTSIVAGDFNGDRNLDLAVASQYADSISLLLGNGDGTFQKHLDSAVCSYPQSIATADFNEDGALDLAVTCLGTNSTSVLLGNGDGTFGEPVSYTTGQYPVAVVAADVNGDQVVDLIVANENSNSISVLLGNGDGSFKKQMVFPTGSAPHSLDLTDFNNDGVPDVVTANWDGISVLFGVGNGTFLKSVAYKTGDNIRPTAVTAADFDGDGVPEIAVGSNFDEIGVIEVFKYNSDGTFSRIDFFHEGFGIDSITHADMNGDGTQDLIFASGANNTICVIDFQNDHFRIQSTYGVGGGPVAVIAADFTGIGHLDLVAADYYSDSVSVYSNHSPVY